MLGNTTHREEQSDQAIYIDGNDDSSKQGGSRPALVSPYYINVSCHHP